MELLGGIMIAVGIVGFLTTSVKKEKAPKNSTILDDDLLLLLATRKSSAPPVNRIKTSSYEPRKDTSFPKKDTSFSRKDTSFSPKPSMATARDWDTFREDMASVSREFQDQSIRIMDVDKELNKQLRVAQPKNHFGSAYDAFQAFEQPFRM
ncbi:hypothetical protein ACFYKX_10400 [Cytobacillus sp. FJAT-54145]|uniref:Uncharacterized protein n=1 Tax=Cytobacillus spartinae TaxID=3299023 RepID=A0ABW6KE92_9BACI